MQRTLGLALARCTLPLLVGGLLGCEPPQPTVIPDEHAHDAEIAALESPRRDTWAKPDEVVAALPLDRADMDVADIGAGSGYFTRRIARRVPQGTVTAVEVDGIYKHYIMENREAWGTPNIETRLALYENPLLPEDSLDLVFLSNTYRYIQDRVSYFQGVHASLRSGGKLVIVAFRADADCEKETDTCPPAVERIRAEDVISELALAGFALSSNPDFLPYQYLLIFDRIDPGAESIAEPDTSVEGTDPPLPADADGTKRAEAADGR